VDDVRLIIDPPQSGPWNMAVDEALLMGAVENGIATLRFYQWNEPTLSLGYFQRYADREQHAASRNCPVVRRQTGGGAILHDRELTYSLTLPPTHGLARQTSEVYKCVHEAFIAALSTVQQTETSPTILRIRGTAVESPAADEPFLCFQRQSPGDVILIVSYENRAGASPSEPGSSSSVWKVLGSAQRRHRGAILQHGSLLMEKSQAAPELPGLRNLNGPFPPFKSLISAVCERLTISLSYRLVPEHLSPELEFRAAELANTKYSSAVWTKRR
jgi:lipoate-protein ligase A